MAVIAELFQINWEDGTVDNNSGFGYATEAAAQQAADLEDGRKGGFAIGGFSGA